MAESIMRHQCFACSLQAHFADLSHSTYTECQPSLSLSLLSTPLRTFNLLFSSFLSSIFIIFVAIIAFQFQTFHAFAAPPNSYTTQAITIFSSILAALLLLIALMTYNTYQLIHSQKYKIPPLDKPRALSVLTEGGDDEEQEENHKAIRKKLLNVLSQAIRCKTVSYDQADEKKMDYREFLKLHDVLRENFPLVHNSEDVSVHTVNNYSLVYHWKAKCAEKEKLKPILLCAHLDVVPVEDSRLPNWQVSDPFGGEIIGDVVFGRGAIDNKHNVIGILEAIEFFLSLPEDKQPDLKRDVYVAFGHDEEVWGYQGARNICEFLLEREKNFEFVFDEGPFLIKKLLPGVKSPIALIGLAEKGNLNVKISCSHFPPGHCSFPDTTGSNNVAVLSKALNRLNSTLFPLDLEHWADSMRFVASEFPLAVSFVVSNLFIFGWLVKLVLPRKPQFSATMRTTTAITKVTAGDKINVIPGEATAFVNHKIHPSMLKGNKKLSDEALINNIVDFDRKVINDDRIQIEVINPSKFFIRPSPITSVHTLGVRVLNDSVREIFGAKCSPIMMVGNTDTRWYWRLSDCIVRFSAVEFDTLEDTKMFHGDNERVSGETLRKLTETFKQVILKSCT